MVGPCYYQHDHARGPPQLRQGGTLFNEPLAERREYAAQQVRIATTELYLDSSLHPAWSLIYDREQGWIWLEQRPEPGRGPTAESTERAHCYGFLVVPEPDPAALWRKVNRYTSRSNFVGELSEFDRRKWQEWNLTLPLRAAVLLGAGASYPLRVPMGGQLLKRLFDRLRAISGLEREYAIAQVVRDKERRSGQRRGTEGVNEVKSSLIFSLHKLSYQT